MVINSAAAQPQCLPIILYTPWGGTPPCLHADTSGTSVHRNTLLSHPKIQLHEPRAVKDNRACEKGGFGEEEGASSTKQSCLVWRPVTLISWCCDSLQAHKGVMTPSQGEKISW